MRYLLIVSVLAWSAPAAAQDAQKTLNLATVAYVGGATADLVTTAACVGTRPRCHELNPAIGWVEQRYGSPALVLTSAALDAVLVYGVRKWVAPRHPTLAAVGLFLGGAVRVEMAASNVGEIHRLPTAAHTAAR